MKITKLAMAAVAASPLLFTSQVNASQYKLVLVHGLQTGHIYNAPSASKVSSDGEAYWSSYWNQVADDRIDWSSAERVEGKIATDFVWPKLKQYAETGFCEPGCIFVTHSTGDLVTRHILENQANWLENAGLQPLNIVATFDIAGAGGGSELADLAVNVAQATEAWTFAIEAALEAWLGDDLSEGLGVMHDLKVNNARQIDANPEVNVPRLRFVGDASDYFGLTSGFLRGNDDGVVSSHSSCGASRSGYFGSCSKLIDFDGEIDDQSDGISGFVSYHYPVLMSDAYSHGTLIDGDHQGKVTAVNETQRFTDGNQMSFGTNTQTYGWWFWKSTYRYVNDSQRKSMSELIYNAAP